MTLLSHTDEPPDRDAPRHRIAATTVHSYVDFRFPIRDIKRSVTQVDERTSEPETPQWHERPGLAVAAGLGVILALGLIVFAVMQTAQHARQPSSIPVPAPSATTTTKPTARSSTTTPTPMPTTSTTVESTPAQPPSATETPTLETAETPTTTGTTTLTNPYSTTTPPLAGHV
jgi:cytoskeletal protein RodZ